MLEKLKHDVYQANLELVKQNLVIYTWGNVSAVDDSKTYMVIKPSGVNYENMTADDMVVLDLNGNIVEGKLNPSSDTPTHLKLYQNYPNLKSIVHTHSEWATSFAQAKRSVPVYGTTHCDYFYGEIPCTRSLREDEVIKDYEHHTACVIIETFEALKVTPAEIPAILVSEHGPFSFGQSPSDAVHNAKVLEEVSKMAFRALVLNPELPPVNSYLLNKHYLRKHGKDAYYGQKK